MTSDPQRFHHRTPEVQAVQWTGDNADQLRAFMGADFYETDPEDRADNPAATAAMRESKHNTWRGLEPGYWIVKLDGGFYEFSAADFAERYEPAAPAALGRADDLADRLEAVLTEKFTELGNPFSRMRIAFQGPDGWPASKEVGPHDVAAVLRELLAVLPPPVDWAAVLLAAATEAARLPIDDRYVHHSLPCDAWDDGRDAVVRLLRRRADEVEQQPDTVTGTLAAMFEGLHHLLATSSRDWQTYRVDAWLWAVLCGWDCEQAEHDDTCTHGALEETAAMHGWDTDTVAKARRYRAAVRALTEPAAVSSSEEPQPQCTAGLMPATSEAVDRCVRHGKHDSHVTASGVRWGNGSDDEEA